MESRFVAKVISGGRITIPEEIRKLFQLEEGDEVEVKINTREES